MKGLPRALLVILGHAIGEAARVAQRSHVDLAGAGTAQVRHHELQCSADRTVGTSHIPEHTRPTRKSKALGRGPADHDQGSGRVRRRLYAVQVEALVARGPDHGDHNLHVLRLAAGHHRVGRDFLDRCGPVAGRDQSDHPIRRVRGRRQQGLDALRGGRDHGQKGGEAGLHAVLERVLVLGEFYSRGPGRALGQQIDRFG